MTTTKLIPTTILTGFLGAGKTTLLNKILHEKHGYKIAVIENEFGAENVDNEILHRDTKEQIIEMNNGCICCTVRGDLIVALTNLAEKRRNGEISFNHVIIETTGLANPGPVAQTFFVDDHVAANYMLDAIITVVDAKHAMQQLDLHQEAQRQVGFADAIFISKGDLVTSTDLDKLSARLKRINPRAPIQAAHCGQIAVADVLNLRGFNLNDKLTIDPNFMAAPAVSDEYCEHDTHSHCDHHEHAHYHLDDISSFVFKSQRPFNTALLDEYLSELVNAFGPQMLRYKGILYMENADCKLVFQGVHQIMGSDVGRPWEKDETKESKIVFIGNKLPKDIFIGGLEQCLV